MAGEERGKKERGSQPLPRLIFTNSFFHATAGARVCVHADSFCCSTAIFNPPHPHPVCVSVLVSPLVRRRFCARTRKQICLPPRSASGYLRRARQLSQRRELEWVFFFSSSSEANVGNIVSRWRLHRERHPVAVCRQARGKKQRRTNMSLTYSCSPPSLPQSLSLCLCLPSRSPSLSLAVA